MTIIDYTSLITSEHSDKPKFMATVAALVAPLVDVINSMNSLPAAFDIDSAIGAQQDVIGEWLGKPRVIQNELSGVYFAFDIPGQGFDQGVWWSPGQSLTGLTILPDDKYRIYQKVWVAIRNWDSTIPGAVKEIAFEYPDGSIQTAIITDPGDMTMAQGFVGDIGPTMTQLFVQGYMDFKPAGVHVSGHLVPSVPGTPFFGFGPETSIIAGFGHGSWSASP